MYGDFELGGAHPRRAVPQKNAVTGQPGVVHGAVRLDRFDYTLLSLDGEMRVILCPNDGDLDRAFVQKGLRSLVKWSQPVTITKVHQEAHESSWSSRACFVERAAGIHGVDRRTHLGFGLPAACSTSKATGETPRGPGETEGSGFARIG